MFSCINCTHLIFVNVTCQHILISHISMNVDYYELITFYFFYFSYFVLMVFIHLFVIIYIISSNLLVNI